MLIPESRAASSFPPSLREDEELAIDAIDQLQESVSP
jgi:hypothetical protein